MFSVRSLFTAALICMILLSFGSLAQKAPADTLIVISDTTDLDKLFGRARELAYNKQYIESQRILRAILEKKPEYYDVRSFLGRTYAWDQQYNEARTEFSRVLIEKPDDAESLGALIDVEIWAEQFIVAGEYLNIALNYFPTSEKFLMQKAKIHFRQQDKLNASLTLRRILEINPGNKDALKMLNDRGDLRLNNHLTLGYTVDMYDKTRMPQQLAHVEYGKSFRFGSLNMRANYADKFEKTGIQAELDSYLHFVKGNYAYFNAGYSESRLFPDVKFGGDIYQKLPAGFEISAGARYMHFPIKDSLSRFLKMDGVTVFKNPTTVFYTGYLGNYFRNYWFALKVYYTPETKLKDLNGNYRLKNPSSTFVLNIRYYISDADNYAGIRLGRGQSPDDRSIASIDPVFLKTYSGFLEIQRAAFGRWIIKGETGYAREETNPGIFRQRYSVQLSFKNVF